MVDVGVVGAGIRGQLFASALRQCPDVRIVAFADPSPAAEQVAAGFGAQLHKNHQDLLAAHVLDGLVVATPDFAHRDAAVDGARAGVNLLIEKPLATDPGQAREIQQTVSEAGVRAMVAFENRWNPKFVVARQQIDEQALGDVLFQTAHLNDTRFVPEQMLSWADRSTPAWFLMPHTVDLALWLSGNQPRTVYATGLRRELVKAGVDTYDGIHALVTFDDDTTLALQSHWVLPESYPSVFDFRFEIVGSKGTLRVDGSDSGVHYAGPAWKWLHHSTLDVGGRITGVAAEIAQCFADLLAGRAVDVPSIAEAVLVTDVVAAVHASVVSGEPIQLT
ncbi:Gfo/Idh/MocA family protein [Flindersiella endophytica]